MSVYVYVCVRLAASQSQVAIWGRATVFSLSHSDSLHYYVLNNTEENGVPQDPLSQRIFHLEEHLGSILFDELWGSVCHQHQVPPLLLWKPSTVKVAHGDSFGPCHVAATGRKPSSPEP